MREPSATVLDVQRLSTGDGPGIRTTVFLKGCSLACAWCHNPESIRARPEVVWHRDLCLDCRDCLGACPEGLRRFDETGSVADRARCRGCGACAEACPAAALELLGRSVGLDELVRELLRDRPYFETSGGGVTVSGGEPALQAGFVGALLDRLGEAGVPTALDTCGQAGAPELLELAGRADLVLFDLKHVDSARHRELTGHGNERILANLASLRDQILARGAPELWVRTPLVPGATATEDNVRGLGALIALRLPEVVSRWELCAFNDLCRDKYRRLGLRFRYERAGLLEASELARLAEVARCSGIDPALVRLRGETAAGERGEGMVP